MKQTLFLFSGYPGSGKSTFAKRLSEKTGIVRINDDELRRSMFADDADLKDFSNYPTTFGALDYMMKAFLSNGLSLIYDANANRVRHRSTKAEIANRYGARTILIVIDTPLATAKQREAIRVLPPRYFRVTAEQYDEVARSTEPPTTEESVITIDGLKPLGEQYKSFCEQLEKLS